MIPDLSLIVSFQVFKTDAEYVTIDEEFQIHELPCSQIGETMKKTKGVKGAGRTTIQHSLLVSPCQMQLLCFGSVCLWDEYQISLFYSCIQ